MSYTRCSIYVPVMSAFIRSAASLSPMPREADSARPDSAEHILASVRAHVADVPANDDLTLFICQRNVGRPPSMQPRRRSGMLNRLDV